MSEYAESQSDDDSDTGMRNCNAFNILAVLCGGGSGQNTGQGVEKYQAEIILHKEKVNRYREEVERLRSSMFDAEKITEELSLKEAEVDRLKEIINSDGKSELEKLSNSLLEKERELGALKMSLKEEKKVHASKLSQIEDTQPQIADLEKQIKVLQKENKTLRKQGPGGQVGANLDTTKQEIKRLTLENQELQKKLTQISISSPSAGSTPLAPSIPVLSSVNAPPPPMAPPAPGGISSPGAPPPPGGPPGPPPPPGGLKGKVAEKMKDPPKKNKPSNLKPLFWEKVHESDIKDSIWEAADSAKVNINTDKLKVVFAKVSIQRKSSQLKTSAESEKLHKEIQEKRKNITILDAKTSNTLGIAMSKLPPNDALVKAILSMDGEIVKPQFMGALIDHFPPDSEIQAIKTIKDPSWLAPVENRVLALGTIPALVVRMQVWSFQLSFEESCSTIEMEFKMFNAACDCLMGNRLLPVILKTVLDIGNILNEGNVKRENAAAFQIDVINRLYSTKTTDGTSNLLSYIAHSIVQAHPEVKNLAKELAPVEEVIKLMTLQDISLTFTKLKSKFGDLERKANSVGHFSEDDMFHEHSDRFFKENVAKIEVLKVTSTKAAEIYEETKKYFMCGKKYSPSESTDFFTLFNSFANDFVKTLG